MPVITGNGSDIIRINGRAVQYQGIAHLKTNMPTQMAAQQLKNDGLEEYFINVRDDKGRTHRILVYGDRLDFSFERSNTVPQVTVNGRPATLVCYDDEPTTFWQGAIAGFSKGWTEALDAISNSSKALITNIAVAGAAAIAGGTALTMFGSTLGLGDTLTATAGGITSSVLWLGAGAALAVAIAIMLKGGFEAMGNKPNMAAIAAVTEEADDLSPSKPRSQDGTPTVGPRPVPPVPAPPVTPPPVDPVDPSPIFPPLVVPIKPVTRPSTFSVRTFS